VPRCKTSRKRRGKEEEKKRKRRGKEEEKKRKEEGKKRKKKRKPTKKGHLFSFTYFLFWELACSSRVHYSFEFLFNIMFVFSSCIYLMIVY